MIRNEFEFLPKINIGGYNLNVYADVKLLIANRELRLLEFLDNVVKSHWKNYDVDRMYGFLKKKDYPNIGMTDRRHRNLKVY